MIATGKFFRKYRVALAFRMLRGENFGNFFRESVAPRAIWGAMPAVTKAQLLLSKANSAHNQTRSSAIRCVDPAAADVANYWAGNFFRKY